MLNEGTDLNEETNVSSLLVEEQEILWLVISRRVRTLKDSSLFDSPRTKTRFIFVR